MVQKMVNEGFFSLLEETFFNVPVHYENFAEFENHTIDATHSHHRLDEKLYALVKQRFEQHVAEKAQTATFKFPAVMDDGGENLPG